MSGHTRWHARTPPPTTTFFHLPSFVCLFVSFFSRARQGESRRLLRLPAEFRRRSALVAGAGAGASASADAPATAEPAARATAQSLRARAAALRSEALEWKRGGDAARAIAALQQARADEHAAQCQEAETEAEPRAAVTPVEAAAADEAEAEEEAAEVDAAKASLQEIFVRRYSIDTRPWIPFHPDAYEVTVNVALSSDAAHDGGRLLGVFDGRVQALERGEGGATVHSSRLLHAVSSMTRGTRYSLIIFFDRRTRDGRRNRWSASSIIT